MGRIPGRTTLSLLGSIAVMGSLGCSVTTDAGGGDADGTITIQNSSAHVLTGVYVAPVNQIGWGPNLLPDVLFTSERITVQVSCSTYDVMVTDYKMPEASGMDVLRRCRMINESTVVLMMTAYGTVESAVEAMRLASHKLPVTTRVVLRESAKEAS